MAVGLGIVLIIAFNNVWRFSPLPDALTDMLAVSGLMVLLLMPRQEGARESQCSQLPYAALVMVLLMVVAVIAGRGSDFLSGQAVLVLSAGAIGSQVFFREATDNGKERLVTLVAHLLVFGALGQALVGVAQALGLASLARGWLVVDAMDPTGNIMGNIGQRNQFAHYLGWGMIAACYLHAHGRLRTVLFLPAIAFLTLVMGWSGSRLVLAYGLGFGLLALLWAVRARQDATVQQFGKAAAWAVMAIAFTQFFMQEINQGLSALGLPLHLSSGADRLMDAGFGARRRVEWTKAWMVFQAHPWFGVGWGGYAAQSVWLEAYGGLPKVPESALFTHSHNLIFQLLAETGIVGTLIVVGGLLLCLLPYFRKGETTPENLFLISMAMVTLGHSMFEYPLWYLPFLLGLCLVLALSPLRPITLEIRPALRRLLGGSLVLAMGVYLATGLPNFWKLVAYNIPAPSVAENEQRIAQLERIGLNPVWRYDADMVLANYLVPSAEYVDIKLAKLEPLLKYRPYVNLLLKVAMLRAYKGDAVGARDLVVQAIAAYPDALPFIFGMLHSQKHPALVPLQRLSETALATYQREGALAAVNTVAAPVSRTLLF